MSLGSAAACRTAGWRVEPRAGMLSGRWGLSCSCPLMNSETWSPRLLQRPAQSDSCIPSPPLPGSLCLLKAPGTSPLLSYLRPLCLGGWLACCLAGAVSSFLSCLKCHRRGFLEHSLFQVLSRYSLSQPLDSLNLCQAVITVCFLPLLRM